MRLASEVQAADVGLSRPAALTWAADASAFLIGDAADAGQPGATLELVSPTGAIVGTSVEPERLADGVSIAYDARHGRLLSLAPGGADIIEIAAARGKATGPARRSSLKAARVTKAAGMAIDNALYILDATDQSVVRIAPDAAGGVDAASAAASGRITVIPLAIGRVAALHGLAVNPTNGDLFALEPATMALYEFDSSGALVASRDLSGVGLDDPRGMVIAPSADATDAPDAMHLFIADSGTTVGGAPAGGSLTELALSATVLAPGLPAPENTGALVSTIATSAWTPASPDPSDLAYIANEGLLLDVDGEVEETTGAGWHDKNGFFFQPSGTVISQQKLNTLVSPTNPTNNEPVGAGYDAAKGELYITKDGGGSRVWVYTAGPDAKFGTSDDRQSRTRSLTTWVADAEGVCVGGGNMYVTDGLSAEIWVFGPGVDGILATGDDTLTHFDTASLGQPDPEGCEYEPTAGTLYVTSNNSTADLLEVGTNGTPVRIVDLAFLNPQHFGGLTIAPASSGSGQSDVYIAERGVDNNPVPTENDGRIYEISIGGTPPPPPGNLLVNPSFETDANADGRPDSWTSKSFFTTVDPLLVTPPFSAHEGNLVGRHFSTTDNAYSVSQDVAVTPGTTYSFSGWVNIPNTSDAFSFKLRVQWRSSTGTTISTNTVKTYTASTGGAWDSATLSVVAPAGSVTARIMMSPTSLNTTIYVDDLAFGG